MMTDKNADTFHFKECQNVNEVNDNNSVYKYVFTNTFVTH